jgi:hypothetical protein
MGWMVMITDLEPLWGGAMFGPLLKIMFFDIKRLLYLIPKLKKMKKIILKDN